MSNPRTAWPDGPKPRRFGDHGLTMLLAMTVIWFGAIGYGVAFDGLGPALGIGAALLVLAAISAYVSGDGVGSQIVLPFLGMALVGLMIHVSHGRQETHFAVFGVLAAQVAYRRALPIVVGVFAIALHHLTFSFFQEWGWGTLCFTEAGIGRVLEHAAYVVAEAVVLLLLARRARKEIASGVEVLALARSLVDAEGRMDLSVAQREVTTPSSRALLQALGRIAQFIADVRNACASIEQVVREVGSGNQALSRRTEATVADLECAAAAIGRIGVTIHEANEQACRADLLSSQSSDVAARGGEAAARVVTTMAGIEESSRRITDIIGVIDAIAFQTNILALNAAVEAARAGEQGRGFAVVAAEVRQLAQRSANAAREIKQLITRSVEQVESGSSLVQDTGNTIEEVVGQVREVSALIGRITTMSRQQSASVEQINESIRTLDGSIRQNAEVVLDVSRHTAVLQEQTAFLARALEHFR